MVLLLKERKANRLVMWRFQKGPGVLSFHAFMCSDVVTEHLFTASFWAPEGLSGEQETRESTSPVPVLPA